MKIRLKIDSRDEHAHEQFGQVVFFPDMKNFDDQSIPEKIQPVGNVECTAYTTTYIGQNYTKKEYDIDELFNRVPHTSQGASPNDVMNEVVKRGFLIKGTQTYDKPFSSYFRADTGQYDAFDNVRSAMLKTNSPAAIWTSWYAKWLNLGSNAVMPMGQTPISGHMYANQGWFGFIRPTTVKGEPMFIIEWWGGYVNYMPREVFNDAVSRLGCGSAVFSTAVLEQKKQKTFWQSISDLLINIWLLILQEYRIMINQ